MSEIPTLSQPETDPPAKARPLNESDAVEIWIARWLRVRPMALAARYRCDTRRLYDIWWGKAFPGTRARAEREFLERYPGVADRTAFGYKRIPRGSHTDPRQGGLFDCIR